MAIFWYILCTGFILNASEIPFFAIISHNFFVTRINYFYMVYEEHMRFCITFPTLSQHLLNSKHAVHTRYSSSNSVLFFIEEGFISNFVLPLLAIFMQLRQYINVHTSSYNTTCFGIIGHHQMHYKMFGWGNLMLCYYAVLLFISDVKDSEYSR
jgi:hypothetical protein